MQEHTAKISQFEDVSIALVGPSVAGKSALINTFASYLSNRLELLAACKSGITQHVLRCSDGNPLRWKMLEPQGALIDVSSAFISISLCSLRTSPFLTLRLT